METPQELPLEAPPEVLAQLVALLPESFVNAREGTFRGICPFTRSLAVAKLREALERGYPIDRSNADGSLSEWDGWLTIETPGKTLYLQTIHSK